MKMFRVPVQSVSAVWIFRVLFAAVVLPIVMSQLSGAVCEPLRAIPLTNCMPINPATATACFNQGCCFDTTETCRAVDQTLVCPFVGALPAVARSPCLSGASQTMTPCLAMGCCFDANLTPICFETLPGSTDVCQLIRFTDRVPCGDSLDQTACESRHCCYDPVKFGNFPRCFWPCPRGTTDCAATTGRTDCGYHGITEEQCQERLCIFDDTIPGIPFCSEGPAKAAGVPPLTTCTTIPAGMRDDCGFAGISQSTCERRGCCYIEANSGPWCFKPVARAITGDCMVDTGEVRQDCGFRGISQRLCEARSCCYDDSVGDNGQPWCYDMIRDAPAAGVCDGITADVRVDCGFPGVTQARCVGRGCCFDPSTPNTIWCFEPAPRAAECNLPAVQTTLVDCGFPGITAAQCRARHCCFDTTVEEGRPECFLKP